MDRFARYLAAGCLASASLVMTSCGDDPSSQVLGELSPVWVVDANRATGRIQVFGRAAETEYLAPVPSVGLFGNLGSIINPTPTDEDAPFPYQGVRLTGGDSMSVQTPVARHQLYRRGEAFVYETELGFDENSPEFDLRLDYTSRRYNPSVTPTRVFEVNGLQVAEQSVVPGSGSINLSWSLGDVQIPEGSEFSQSLDIHLTGCASGDIAFRSLVLPVDLAARSIELTVGDLPQPLYSDNSVPFSTDAPTDCTYRFQVSGVVKPVDAFTLPEPAVDPEVTSRVVLVSRSGTIDVQVNNGPEQPQ